MIIYLYGPDSYRRLGKAAELFRAYREKNSGLDTLVFDFAETEQSEWPKVREFLGQPSMFVEKKLALLHGPSGIADRELAKTIDGYKDNAKIFIIVSDDKPPVKDFSFLLRPPVKAQEFPELQGGALSGFLEKEAERRGLVFGPPAWQFFCAYIAAQPERSWLGVNELEKISLAGLKKPIVLSDLEKVVNFERRIVLFRAATEILKSRPGSGLPVLERLLLQKEAPAHIFNTLAFQATGQALLKLADYDIAVKSGNLEYEEALTEFVLSF